jgi:Flp pilus assembly pilin Flp
MRSGVRRRSMLTARNRIRLNRLGSISSHRSTRMAQRLRYVMVAGAVEQSGSPQFTRNGNKRVQARGGQIMNLISQLRMFTRNEEAQDLIEYALLVGLISLVAVVAMGLAGVQVNTIFTNITARLTSAA